MRAKLKMIRSILYLFILLVFQTGFSQVKLPRLISDGMVLQRDAKVKIWGWASPGEKISIKFVAKIYKTTAQCLW